MAKYTAGSATVDIVPSLEGFHNKIRAQLKKINDQVQVDVAPDTSGFQQKLDREVKRAKAPEVKVNVEADIAKAQAKIRELEAKRNEATVQVDADIAKARAKITELENKRGTATINVDAEIDRYQAQIARLEAQRHRAQVHVDADIASASAKLAEVSRDRHSTVHVDVDRNAVPALASIGNAAGSAGSVMASAFGSGVQAVGQVAVVGVAASGAIIMVGQAAVAAAGLVALLPAALGGLGASLGAVIVGSQGVIDAFKAMTKGGQEARDALAKLSPAAARFVTETYGLRDAWRSVQQATQEALYSGLGDQMTRLAGVYVPLLRDGLSGVASALNGVAKGFADTLMQGQNVAKVSEIFGATKVVIDNLGRALGPVMDAFLTLAAVGSRVFADFTRGAGDAAQSFKSWMDSIAANGTLQRFLENALQAAVSLWNTFKYVGSAAVSLFNSLATGFTGQAQIAGQFRSMEAGARSFSDWAKGPDGSGMFVNLGAILRTVSDILVSIGRAFMNVVQAVGPQFGSTLNTLKDVVVNFLNGGMGPLATTLDVALKILNGFMTVLSPFAGVLGSSAGAVLGAVAAWKLFSVAVSGVSRAFTLLNPANIQAGVERIAGSALQAGNNMGIMGGATGQAGGRVDKFSAGISRAGAALGGLAAVGTVVYGVINSIIPDSDEMIQKLLQGGYAAEDARNEIKSYGETLSTFVGTTYTVNAVQEEYNRKLEDARAKMSPLEKAQNDVTQAQNNLNMAQSRWGTESQQAGFATDQLKDAQWRLKVAQNQAEWATMSATDKIKLQTDTMLAASGSRIAYEQSLLQLQRDQDALNAATAAHGPASNEAKEASLQYGQTLLSVIQNVGTRAEAEAKARGETDTARFATMAMNQEILRLAGIAGQNAPPELQKLVNGMDNSALAALGAHREIDGAGNAVVVLPDGKRLTFPNNAPQTQGEVDSLKAAIDRVPEKKTITFFAKYMDFLTAGPSPAAPPGAPPLLGGFFRRDGGLVPGYADGGQFNPMAGGLFHGKGGPRDDANIVAVSSGEYIVNAASTAANLPLLEAINRGALQGFATGGQVGGGSAPVGSAPGGAASAGAQSISLQVDPDAVAAMAEAVDALTASLAAMGAEMTAVTVPMMTQLQILNGLLAQSYVALQVQQAASWSLMAANMAANYAAWNLWQTQYQLNQTLSWQAIALTTVLQMNTMFARALLFQQQMDVIWYNISTTVWNSTNSQIQAFNALMAGMGQVRDSMLLTANWAVDQYARMREAAAEPIRWIMRFPFSEGIIKAWNYLDGQFQLGKHLDPVLPAFASGGRVHGPGNGTSDSVPARLSRGEFVIRESIAKQSYPFLSALNSGNAEALQATGGPNASLRFAEGGAVDPALQAAIDRGLAFARAQAGKPYVWGGVGPGGYDCSGLTSAITNVLRGEAPHRRLGTTNSMPWPGFTPGLTSAWSLGWNGHHMAGTLAGTNVEARDFGIPVLIGPAAAGADNRQFSGQASLPAVGGRFVSGGPGGGGFDVQAIVDAAFADTYRMIGDIDRFFPGNFSAGQGKGIATQAADKVKARAVADIMAKVGMGGFANVPFDGNIANLIMNIAKARGMGRQGALIGLITGLVESGLRNLNHGDRDSLGVFQQRPSQGWGTPQQIMDPVYSTNKFFSALQGVAGWPFMEPGAAAQRVQRSAFPGRYSQRIPQANAIINAAGIFDQGGLLQGKGLFHKDTIQPERVLSPQQTRSFDTLVSSISSRDFRSDALASTPVDRGITINQTVNPAPGMDERALAATSSRHIAFGIRTA